MRRLLTPDPHAPPPHMHATPPQIDEEERQGVEIITMDTASGKQVQHDGTLKDFDKADEQIEEEAREEAPHVANAHIWRAPHIFKG